MIELNNLTIETRHSIMNNINYLFLDNKIYGIVSENGGGKTTFFRTLVNLKTTKNGAILFDKSKSEKMLKHIFYFETIEWLDKNLSGLDYLKLVQRVWKSDLEIAQIIKTWDMDDFIKLSIAKYSLGMKQRLIIAMYILSDAKFMLMDEITSGLDEATRELFFSQIKKLKMEGKTILLSSHYSDEIKSVCDIVLQIKDKCLVEVSL